MRPGFEFLPLAEVRQFVDSCDASFSTMELVHNGDTQPSGLMLISSETPERNAIVRLNEAGEAPAFEARSWADATLMAVLAKRYG